MSVVVDTHVHVYRSKAEGRRATSLYDVWEYGTGGRPLFADWDGDEADVHEAMKQAGVDYGVVASLMDPPLRGKGGVELVRFNEWVLDLGRRNPALIPCLAVDPRYLPVPDLVDHLSEMVGRGGVAGIKIHPPAQQWNLSDERLWPVFETCSRLGLRVIAHSGPSATDEQLGEPNAFRPLLITFPNLRISLAHLGGAAWRQTAELAQDFPAVHFDLCEIIEWTGAERAPTERELVQLIKDVGPRRVMMGSDFPWYHMTHAAELVRMLPGLTVEERDGILGGNAARFFGLASSTPGGG